MLTFPPDITFVVQLVSFFVLLYLMKTMLFDPYQELLAERAQRTEGDAAEAVAERAEAEELAAKIDRELAEARQQTMTEVDALRRETKTEQQALYDRARDQSASRLAGLREEIARERRQAAEGLRGQAEKLADDMVAAVLGTGAKA